MSHFTSVEEDQFVRADGMLQAVEEVFLTRQVS